MLRRITLALVALALVAVPAAAAETKERTGTRINLMAGGLQFFPAGEPFYIQHGWGTQQGPAEFEPRAIGKLGFELAVDGVDRREDFVDKFHFDDPVRGLMQARQWVHNFPDGMTGTHTFTGHWFGGCTGLVASGLDPGPCDKPAETITVIAPLTITVVFVP